MSSPPSRQIPATAPMIAPPSNITVIPKQVAFCCCPSEFVPSAGRIGELLGGTFASLMTRLSFPPSLRAIPFGSRLNLHLLLQALQRIIRIRGQRIALVGRHLLVALRRLRAIAELLVSLAQL